MLLTPTSPSFPSILSAHLASFYAYPLSVSIHHCLYLSLFVSLSLCLSTCSWPIHSQVGRTFDPTTAFVVEDLKPNTEYAFRLAARSPQGLGAFTAVVRQRTLQASTCLSAPYP